MGLKGKTRRVKWCYIGKELPESIAKKLITQKEQMITQEFTQSDTRSNTLKFSSNQQKKPINLSLPVLLANTRQQCMLSRIC
jgi:hypothetical protein